MHVGNSERYAQDLRVGIGVDMPVSFLVQKLAKVHRVHEVAIHTHGKAEW